MNQMVAANDRPLTAMDIRHQVNTIQEVMQDVMKPDVHYGVITGTDKPSLYKAGAEKIMATFRLAADPEVEDLSDDDQVRYRVKVRLTSPSGVFVGSGIGECSSSEEKYKWRFAVCDEEFESTPENRRRIKWKRGWQNQPAKKVKQVRTEPADQANTVLKMAKKRGLVDAVLTATAASDCFSQDIEDLPEEYLQQHGEEPERSRQTKELPLMTDEEFAQKRDQTIRHIMSGKYTAQKVIDFISTKYRMTDGQKQTLINAEQQEQRHENDQ